MQNNSTRQPFSCSCHQLSIEPWRCLVYPEHGYLIYPVRNEEWEHGDYVEERHASSIHEDHVSNAYNVRVSELKEKRSVCVDGFVVPLENLPSSSLVASTLSIPDLLEEFHDPPHGVGDVRGENPDNHGRDQLGPHILVPINLKFFILSFENRKVIRQPYVDVKINQKYKYGCVEEKHEE